MLRATPTTGVSFTRENPRMKPAVRSGWSSVEEFPQVFGYTTVDFSPDGTIQGEATMSFYGNAASQDLFLSSYRNGANIGNEGPFTSSVTWLIPMGWDLTTRGSMPGATCNITASGHGNHRASILWDAKETAGAATTSDATPRNQPACPPPPTGGGAGGGGSGGDGSGFYRCYWWVEYDANGNEIKREFLYCVWIQQS
jgi:hypothetical protein